MSIDTEFSRHMLTRIHRDVRRHFPDLNLRKAAWVYDTGRDHWEFHGPNGFYWHGRAGNAYDARARGWLAYLERRGLDVEASGED